MDRHPVWQILQSAAELCRLAHELDGMPYDTWGVVGFALSNKDDVGQEKNRLNNPEKFFYSEVVDTLLRATEYPRPVPLSAPWKLAKPS